MLTPRTSAELPFIADSLSRVPDVEGPEDAARRQGLSATADARDRLEAHLLPNLKSLPIDYVIFPDLVALPVDAQDDAVTADARGPFAPAPSPFDRCTSCPPNAIVI